MIVAVVAVLCSELFLANPAQAYDQRICSYDDTVAFAHELDDRAQDLAIRLAPAQPDIWRLTHDSSGYLVATNAVADDLAGAADRAAASVGAGRGPVHGTRVHSAFADEIAALGRSDVFSEVSYLNGRVVPYGTPGSVRLDVVVGDPLAPTAIYDLKTGSAALTTSRIDQIRSHLPVGFDDIPVLEVRP